MHKLLIIESPNKIHTISKYLDDKEFKIIATVGHVRDLSSNTMGFNEKTLEPNWIIPKKKKDLVPKEKIVIDIKEEAKKADEIYLATDPDREGEAISWHVYSLLPEAEQKKCKRITFNEITKTAIQNALNSPRELDIKWVESQFARRILDRLVGYKISRILRNKVHGRSAGRVQSVALKMIYDREKEISQFKPTKWWTIDPIDENNDKLILRKVSSRIKDLNVERTDSEIEGTGINFKDVASAQKVKYSLTDNWKIYNIDDPKQYRSMPKDPYKTSTLQQDGINRLSWSVSKVTSVAQKLYEGVKINNEFVALISYPRTDSVRISDTFIKEAKKFIIKVYGENYFSANVYKNKKDEKNVQNAHEAIRVIDPFITPKSIKDKVTRDEYQLYNLIWCRTLAAFMTPAIYETTIIRIINNDNKFYSYSRILKFDGYKKVYNDEEVKQRDLKLSPELLGTKAKIKDVEIKEHTTNPPARFNQASLIKELDNAGVGRPSTYRSMANMSLERGYAELVDRSYRMLPLGDTVVDFLSKFFKFVLDVEFTNKVEKKLDDVASGEEDWKKVVREFQPKIEEGIQTAKTEFKTVSENVGRVCPKCGAPLLYRYTHATGAKFIGCSNFPKCKYSEFPNQPHVKELSLTCPKCHKPLVLRMSKKKRLFVGCSGYPKCKFIMSTTSKQIKTISECVKNNTPLPPMEAVEAKFKPKKSSKKTTKK